MVKKIVCIIQARMGSTRLKGKVLRILKDKSVLGHIITRIQKVVELDDIIIATSDNKIDDVIELECEKYGIKCFRGSEENVLKRYYDAAVFSKATDIVRICADNPLLDWHIINEQIKIYKQGLYGFVCSDSNVPLGLGGEIFSFEMLKKANELADNYYQREHVTPYIYDNEKKIFKYQIEKDYSKYRLTLDTEEDWSLIEKLYDELYTGEHDFLLDDISSILQKNTYLLNINAGVIQRGCENS